MSAVPTLVTVLTYNEGEKLKRLMQNFPPDPDYDLLFVDDGSDDGTSEFLDHLKWPVIRHRTNTGVGAGIRDAVAYARENKYGIIVIMAGNGKMQPREIPRLTSPIKQDLADYVQGSRYLEGGQSPNLPLFRRITIRLFTGLVRLFLGYAGTDVTCGFRAYRLAIFDHQEIDLSQEWLDRYELEYYLHYKVHRLGFRVTEVPVSMIYPRGGRDYSKIKPLVGWWSMIRPWVFLVLRIKK